MADLAGRLKVKTHVMVDLKVGLRSTFSPIIELLSALCERLVCHIASSLMIVTRGLQVSIHIGQRSNRQIPVSLLILNLMMRMATITGTQTVLMLMLVIVEVV